MKSQRYKKLYLSYESVTSVTFALQSVTSTNEMRGYDRNETD